VVPRRRRALVAADGLLRVAAARMAARRAPGGPGVPLEPAVSGPRAQPLARPHPRHKEDA
jgi:hypothetical protein